MIGSYFPRFYIVNSANLDLPSIIIGRMGETKGSTATGYDRKTIIRSAGEALERQVGFSQLPMSGICRKLNQLEYPLQQWFKTLFGRQNKPGTDEHEFSCVEAFRLNDNKKFIVPSIPFTLSPHQDNHFMPHRDSSGCAIHSNSDLALESAVAELIERQGLTLFWYFGHLNHSVDLSEGFLKKEEYYEILPLLNWYRSNVRAKIYLFDISVLLPYRSILAIYVDESGPIHFAAGGAASKNVTQAVKKALIELYQAYTLTYQNVITKKTELDISETQDNLTKGYLQFNNTKNATYFINLAIENNVTLNTFYSPPENVKNINAVDVFVHKQEVSFGKYLDSLTYISTFCIPGFPCMTIEGSASRTELEAAIFFGYNTQINFGPVPFA
ncbi:MULTISPECIES: YcaO-like family protein [unclassified Neisseria]|uniref:YcaO-like family protein n=1 Tax=unclassified Neisseria TaxID=2623750 RepID=UPI0026653DC7|nr:MULTISPECIES: YcaO-like family protein [unclassified Neisseria]MDO1510223.1 YcaO-like family protein [Neisseria sp. MVDL19-042950]MDO1516392.1 YcaO-like family protein [Neisseria sp. MVDL18-041461]MDO1563540.1 YcaO-like family protein [Neisseria sp. MVDL20-010259]